MSAADGGDAGAPPLSPSGVDVAAARAAPPPDDALADATAGQLQLLREQVAALRGDKQRLHAQLDAQERELAIARHRIQELEREVRVATGKEQPVDAAAPLPDPPPAAAPPPAAVFFDRELAGDGLELTDDAAGRCVTAGHTNQYSKLCLCRGAAAAAFDAAEGCYAEFTIDRAFPRFTNVGVVREAGLPRLNVNTDSIGEHDFSYSWNGHAYWSGSLLHNGASQGPRGGEWKVGSRVGVLVRGGAVSFYLDGALHHPHAFAGLTGPCRFGVSFGGIAEQGSHGQISVAPAAGAPPPTEP